MNIRALATASVLFATVSLPPRAQADLYQWDGGLSHGTSADANWSTGTNWVGGVAPSQ